MSCIVKSVTKMETAYDFLAKSLIKRLLLLVSTINMMLPKSENKCKQLAQHSSKVISINRYLHMNAESVAKGQDFGIVLEMF